MRILLTGATGFVGRHVARALSAAGHEVVGCARRRSEAFLRYPEIGWIKGDFASDRSAAAWAPRLTGFDAVINAAGILRERAGQTFEAVHFDGPLALFEACVARGVRKVIHVSALGCDGNPRPYGTTKLRLERALAALDLDWLVVRPSLVYGDDSASSILFRALARLPLIPVVGDGSQRLQPMHADDLALAIVRLLEPNGPVRAMLELGGPRPVTYKEFLAGLRAGLYGKPARFVGISVPFARVGALASDLIGAGPIGVDTLSMLLNGNVAENNAARALLGRDPGDIEDLVRRTAGGAARNGRCMTHSREAGS
jgi:uncharacterized protein YbjT (DUF2867 family)